MEQRLKERLVGATLLVVAGIVFIPWLLDGRGETRPVTQPLTLPQDGDATTRTKTIPLVERRQSQLPAQPQVEPPPAEDAPARASRDTGARPAPTPTPAAVAAPATKDAAATSAEATPTSTPAARSTPEPAPAPAKRASPATSTPAAGDPVAGWAVQVGAFSSQSNAARLAERLSGKGYKAFVSRKVVDGRVLYRVRVGPEATRAAAEELGTRLKADKQPVRVVEHPG